MSLKEKILIADDSEMNQMLLEEILSDKYEYVMAKDGTEAVDILEKNEDIDLVMLDINMPKMDGFGVLEIMNLRHWISEVPVIIISSESDVDFIRRGYDLGASDYISRPFDLTVVRRRVENTLMLYARQKRLVRLVEEQVYEREKTNNTMINILSHVIEYRNNESGQHILHVRTMTDILLRRLIEITDKYPLTETDISMIASHEDEAECARCGGDNDAPTRSSFMNFYRDTLTGTYTRLYLESFQSNLESADAVAIVDVDLFKQINDTYGHPVGDEALKTIANTIRSGIRGSDTLIRYGGDEFLLIFSKIGEEVFYERLKQLRRAVQETKLPDYPEVKLDVSLGGVYRVHPLSEAIRQADLRMYENKAKHANGNHAACR